MKFLALFIFLGVCTVVTSQDEENFNVNCYECYEINDYEACGKATEDTLLCQLGGCQDLAYIDHDGDAIYQRGCSNPYLDCAAAKKQYGNYDPDIYCDECKGEMCNNKIMPQKESTNKD